MVGTVPDVDPGDVDPEELPSHPDPTSPDDVERFINATVEVTGATAEDVEACLATLFDAREFVDRQLDIVVDDLSVNEPLILHESNEITAEIRNRGDTPTHVTVVLGVSNGTRDQRGGTQFSADESPGPYTRQVSLNGTSSRTVIFHWDGTVPPAGGAGSDVPLKPDPVINVSVQAFVYGTDFLSEDGEHPGDPHPENNRQSVGRDMVRYDVELEPHTAKEPDATRMPGDSWKSFFFVRNEGDVSDTIKIVLDGKTPSSWSYALEKDTVSLSPGDQTLVWVRFTAPSDAASGGRAQANIRATSTNSPTAPDAMDTLSMQSAEIGTVGGFFVRASPVSGAVPGSPEERSVTFEINVTNQQNGPAETALSVLPDPDENGPAPAWMTQGLSISPDPEKNQAYSAGGKKTFVVTINVPGDALAGDYAWGIEVRNSTDEWAAPEPYLLSVGTFRDVALPTGEFPSTVEMSKGAALTPINLTIVNQGNAPDDVALSLIESPDGWDLVDVNGNPYNAHIEADSTVETNATETPTAFLRVPSTSPAGKQSLQVLATSVNASDTTDDIFGTTTVPERVFPDIAVEECLKGKPACEQAVSSESTVTFDLTLTNLGNVEDLLNLTNATEIGGGTTAVEDWNVSVTPEETEVESGDSTSATVTVEAPPKLAPSDLLWVNATLKATSYDHVGSDETLPLRVSAAYPDLVVDGAGVDPDPMYRGIPGNLTVDVENVGTRATDGPVNVTASYKNQEGETIAERTATGPALTTTSPGNVSSVHIPVPTDDPDVVTATISVDDGGDIEELDKTNNEMAGFALNVRRFDIAVSAPPDLEVAPGQAVSLEGDLAFLVENAGAFNESLIASLTSQPEWVDESWNFALDESESTNLSANFQVPDQPGVTQANLSLAVRHSDHEGLVSLDWVLLQLDDTAPPVFSDLRTEPVHPPVGTPVNFSAQIEDATGVDQAKLFVVAPSGAVHERAMTKDPATGRYFAVETFDEPGEYEWHVWARDLSSEGVTSDTSDDPEILDVSSESDPSLSLISPAEDSVLQPGERIAVTVTNTTRIDQAAYVLDGRETPLAASNPVQIDTTNWPEGQTEVTVRIVDAFGSTAEATYRFRLDGTPPDVSNLTFEPGAPSGGTPVDLHVEVHDASDIASVVARVQTASGQAEDVPMETGSGGTYTAAVTYPHRDGSLTVIAEDVAGNRGVLEHGKEAVDRSDLTGGLLPLPGSLAVWALVVGAVAWTIRRRWKGAR